MVSQSNPSTICILGGGVTGLAVGYASGAPVYEAAPVPGGICSSYYVRPGETERLPQAPDDGKAYRFEIGGGHWIFGGDPAVLRLIRRLAPVRAYRRRSAVFFAEEAGYVPYPLQYHLSYLDDRIGERVLREVAASSEELPSTMAEWLVARFGPTLTEQFFGPFHERYTAGLWTKIAPQDPYKSPVDVKLVRQGVRGDAPATGYNIRFVYPEAGLDGFARALAAGGDVRYNRRAVAVDTRRKVVTFESGEAISYDVLVSTLPLHRMMAMAGLQVDEPPDPATSVLVLNVGAVRGARCPDHHWLYVPDSQVGFFRVGFYSNVEPAFVPRSARGECVSIYVERAYPASQKPTQAQIDAYAAEVIAELQAWRFIGDVEVVDPTWIDVAYTWRRPGSAWRTKALKALEDEDILMVGRYGRWTFQGIADSIRDGLVVGTVLKEEC